VQNLLKKFSYPVFTIYVSECLKYFGTPNGVFLVLLDPPEPIPGVIELDPDAAAPRRRRRRFLGAAAADAHGSARRRAAAGDSDGGAPRRLPTLLRVPYRSNI